MAAGDLKEYKRKRNLKKTPEPSGRRSRSSKQRFVIQKHDATSLHYDFRLEVAGVLKSWAIPKGPSTNPKDKRLATLTEDHPVDYIDFEGTIPEGEYGAGTVIVWDTGTFENLSESDGREVPLPEALEDGHAKVWLEGEKIRGGYALTRMGGGKDKRWLLVKLKDEEADARRNPVKTESESVISGRTIEEVAEEQGGGLGEPVSER